MEVVHTVRDMKHHIDKARSKCLTVGLVPTMGALHKGHLSLVKRAQEQCGFVVVSIFVNPTQFGVGEDYAVYPRMLDKDALKCADTGVDIVFAPSASEMYPTGCDSWVAVRGITEVLEGAIRPAHYEGVTTVCAKLFNITDADFAYFGKKDYQQLCVILKMVRDLNMKTCVVPCEIVRECDGLAMSSRNAYLSADERRAAAVLSLSLERARALFECGERDAANIRACVESVVSKEQYACIDYVEVVDQSSFVHIDMIDRPTVLLLVVGIGSVRLLDNIELVG